MLLSDGRVIPESAFAETTPILSNGYFYNNSTMALTGRQATYSQLYKSQAWVSTVIDKVAGAAARLPIKVWDHSPATGKDDATDTPYGRLIASPCMGMPPVSFWRWTFATYEIFGEAFWLKVRDGNGRVVQVLPMHPTRTVVRRETDGALWYRFSLGVAAAGIIDAPEADVVPFLRYDPDNRIRGLSRLEPLRMTLLNEDAARRANSSFWEKGARPSVLLKHPKVVSDDAAKRLQTSFSALNAGPDNTGRVAVIEEGMEAQIIQLNAEEMQYIESRRLNREEVCAVYDVPPPAVHILDRATFSNITENLRSLYRDTMMPRLIDVESTIDHYLRPDFDSDGSQRATFVVDDVTRGDFETRAEATQKLVTTGIMKPSEARPMFDLPDAGPVADQLYGNAALVPLGSNPKAAVATDGTLLPEPLDPNKAWRDINGRLGSATDMVLLAAVAATLVAEGHDPLMVGEAKHRIESKMMEGAA